MTDTDSPGAPLQSTGTPISRSRADSFVLTVMYRPGAGIYVPVGTIDWGWSGSATYDAASQYKWTPGQFTRTPATTNPTYTAASGNSDFPVWDYNIEDFKWRTM